MKLEPLHDLTKSGFIKVLDESSHRKIDAAHVEDGAKISVLGDYAANNNPDINMFEFYFYIGGKEYCGLELYVMGYELDGECDKAEHLKIAFNSPKELDIDLKELFTGHGRADILICRANRTGQYTAMHLFENCKLMCSSREKLSDNVYKETLNFVISK
jgi:hypothetical protein